MNFVEKKQNKISGNKVNRRLFIISLLSVISALICGFLHFYPFPNNEVENSFFNQIKKIATNVTVAFNVKDYFEAEETERTFLVLFQNEMELRPGGGYIGSFGIFKVANGEIVEQSFYDSNVMDNTYNGGQSTPYPFKEWIDIHEWEFRDSNWSPDFSVNVLKTLEFYDLMQKNNSSMSKNFDAVVAVNTKILTTALEYTGPVKLDQYDVTFSSEDAEHTLEHFVERDYKNLGLNWYDRKDVVIKDLASEIMKKVNQMGKTEKALFASRLFELLDNKDIMIYSFDQKVQKEFDKKGWSGKIKNNKEEQDFLMLVDANVGSMKMDPFIERTGEYRVDWDENGKGYGILNLKYKNTLTQADWRTNTFYRSYLRVYVSKNCWLNNVTGTYGGLDTFQYGEENDKKVFGMEIRVPLGGETNISLRYKLPETIDKNNYDLIYDFQSGNNWIIDY